jgi:HEAT repeat protein
MGQKEDNQKAETWRVQLARLVSGDWRERQEAVENLASSQNLPLSQALMEVVRTRHADLNALSAALQVLERVGQSITNDLIKMMQEPDPDLRIYIPLVLGPLGDKQAVPALTALVADEAENENARFNAIEALGKLRAEEAVGQLVNILRQDSRYLRYAAVIALGEIGSTEPINEVTDLLDDPFMAEPAVTALGMIGNAQAVPRILRWMKAGTQHDVITAVSAVAAIGRREESAVRDLMKRTADVEITNKLLRMVQSAHSQLPDSTTEKRDVIEAETNPWWGDLALVLSWLVESEGAEEVEILKKLAEMLLYPAAFPTGEAALRAAGTRATDVLVALLEKMIDQHMHISHPDAVYAAARLLGETGDPKALDLFLVMLQEGDEILAVLAAMGIGKIGSPQAVDALFRQLNHPEIEGRRAVIAALASLGTGFDITARAQALLHAEDPNLREASLRILAAAGPGQNADQLFAALSDPSTMVRQAVLELLPQTGDARTAQALSDALDDEDPQIRACAVHMSAILPKEQALPLLEQAIQHHDMWVRRLAALGLGKHGQPEHIRLLVGLLRDTQVPVRAAAVQALAECTRSLPEGQADDRAYIESLLSQKMDEDGEDEEIRMAARTALLQIMAERRYGNGR